MTINRRSFLNKSLKASGFISMSTIAPGFSFCNTTFTSKIDAIELFRYDINTPLYFSFGTWYNRQHIFMKISSGNYSGWSEIPATVNNPELNIAEWGNYLKLFKGLTLNKAFEVLKSFQKKGTEYSFKNLEFIEMGLLDLLGKVKELPVVEILDLKGRKPIPGLFTILDNNIEKVKEKAQNSIAQKLDSHVKIKMYGNQILDAKILKTVRGVLGTDAIIISDPNYGYKDWKNLDELAQIILRHKENDLYAMEDPSDMTMGQWAKLQKKVGDFMLIPDVPLRPAWKGVDVVFEGMGKAYNLHPSAMGSFKYAVELSKKIKSFGGKVMIGDDSLIGPACNAWQQIAIGAEALWVEAIEKKGDSNDYLGCIESKASYQNDKGYFGFEPKPGFGLELNMKKLKRITTQHCHI